MKSLFIVALMASSPYVICQFDKSQLNQMLSILNQQRASAGKGPLCLSDKLTRTAQQHSNDQARLDSMDHDLGSKGGTDFGARINACGFQGGGYAENVAMASYFDINQPNEGWWNSPGHKNNILGDYTHVGIAMAKNGRGNFYYTQFFGSSGSEACSSGYYQSEPQKVSLMSVEPSQTAPAPAPSPLQAAPAPMHPRNLVKSSSKGKLTSSKLANLVSSLNSDYLYRRILPRYAPKLGMFLSQMVPKETMKSVMLPIWATCIQYFDDSAWNKYFFDVIYGKSRTRSFTKNMVIFISACRNAISQ